MVSYIIAAFFFAIGLMTGAGNVAPSSMIVMLTFWTVAALVLTAQRVEDKRGASMKRHPSSKKQDTDAQTTQEVYDWTKDKNWDEGI